MAWFIFVSIIVFFLGAVFGSFTSMMAYRLVHKKSLLIKRSFCTSCHHNLSAGDLIPVISWLLLRGRCRYCKASIPKHYWFTEALLGMAFLLVFLIHGLTAYALLFWLVAMCLAILIKVDLMDYWLPDSVQAALAVLGLVYAAMRYEDIWYVSGGALLYFGLGLLLRSIGRILKKREAFGWGDVKLLAVIGIFLGTDMRIFAIFLLLCGILGMATALIWRISGRGAVFPFGPALALGLFLCLIFSEMREIIPALAQHYR